MKYILLLLTLMYIVSSCNGTHQQRDILSSAELLMNNNPDSALVILVKDSSLVANLPRSLKMKYELLLTSAQNKTFVSFKSDSIMKEVVDYYDSHGTSNEQMQAHYLLGCVYFKLNDSPKAMRCLHEAIERVDTTNADCNYNLLSRVYNVMGYIYGRQLDYNNSLRQLYSAYKYAMLSKDTLLAINCYEQRIDAYSILKKTDSVISISESVSAMYREMNMNREAAVALAPSLFEHLEQGNIMKAKLELDYIEGQPDIFDKNGHIAENLNLYYFKGAYYMNVGRMDSAEYYYRLGLKTEKNITNKVELCKGMYQLHKKLGQKDSTVKYVELWNFFSDSLYATLTTSTLQQMQSLYDYSRNQEIAETKSEEARVANNKFYLILFVSVILLFISYEFFIYYKRKKNIEIQHLSENLLEKLRELDFLKDENLRNIELLNKKQSEYNLLNEERVFDKELLSLREELNSLKDFVAQDKVLLQKKELEIVGMKQSLERYKRVYSQSERKKILEELCESPRILKLKKLAVKGSSASATDLANLKQLIKKSYTSFYITLHDGKLHLSDREQLICILVKLGFETSLIANLLDSSSPAISNTKKTLLLKIFNKDGGQRILIQK